MATLRRVIHEIEYVEKNDANIDNATAAQLCYLVRQAIHIFSYNKEPLDVEPRQFLPFPDLDTPESARPAGPSEATRLVLREALRRQRIPLHVFSALFTAPERGG